MSAGAMVFRGDRYARSARDRSRGEVCCTYDGDGQQFYWQGPP